MKRKPMTLGWSNFYGPVASFELHTVYDLIDIVRKRPEVFLGSRTLTGLYHFIAGFEVALHAVGNDLKESAPPFRSFHQWIQRRLDGKQGVGWHETLLEVTRDERGAFDRFLLEVDEFRRVGGLGDG